MAHATPQRQRGGRNEAAVQGGRARARKNPHCFIVVCFGALAHIFWARQTTWAIMGGAAAECAPARDVMLYARIQGLGRQLSAPTACLVNHLTGC